MSVRQLLSANLYDLVCDDFSVADDVLVGGDITVTGDTNVTGDTKVTGELSVVGDVELESQVTIYGNYLMRSSAGNAPLGVVAVTDVAGVSVWTASAPPIEDWHSVCWSPELGIFCSVGFGGANRVMTSHNGINWTPRTLGAAKLLLCVCWSPQLRLFCACGGDSINVDQIMTSPDGITWTVRVTPIQEYRSICWSPELGLFCAVAQSTALFVDKILTSPDGITWTARVTSNALFRDICWSPELGIFCVVGTTGVFMTSPDGIVWTESVLPVLNTFTHVCWSPELGIFCAVSNNGGTDCAVTSPDGITWTVRVTPSTGYRNVVWSPQLGIFCSTGQVGVAMTSPDGITWTPQVLPSVNNFVGNCWSPELGIFCSVSYDGANRAIISKRVLDSYSRQNILGTTNVQGLSVNLGSAITQYNEVINTVSTSGCIVQNITVKCQILNGVVTVVYYPSGAVFNTTALGAYTVPDTAIPVGFRPSQTSYGTVMCQVTGVGEVIGTYSIGTGGVTTLGYIGTINAGTGAYVTTQFPNATDCLIWGGWSITYKVA